MAKFESHCAEFVEAAERLVERLRLKAAESETVAAADKKQDRTQRAPGSMDGTPSSLSSDGNCHKDDARNSSGSSFARCALEDAIESEPKTVLVAYLNGVHQLVPVNEDTVSQESPVELSIIYSEPLDALCTAEIRHGFSVIRQSIEHRTAAKRVPTSSTADHIRTATLNEKSAKSNSKANSKTNSKANSKANAVDAGHAQFFPPSDDAIGMGFTHLDIAQGRIVIKQIEIRDFYAVIMKGRVDSTRALFASRSESDAGDADRRLDRSWILYESAMWQSLVSRLPDFSDFLSLRFLSRNVGFALGAMKRLKNQHRFADPVARKCILAASFHRVHTVHQCLAEYEAETIGKVASPTGRYTSCNTDHGEVHDAEGKAAKRVRSIIDGTLSESDAFELLSDAQSLNKKVTTMFKSKHKTSVEPDFKEEDVALPNEVRFDQFREWLREFRVRLRSHSAVVPRLLDRGGAHVDTKSLLPSLESPRVRTLHAQLKALDLPLDVSQIVFMCQSGSAMYGLNVDTSDKDYMIIFAVDPTSDFARCDPPPRTMFQHHVARKHSQDKSDVVEFTAIDVQKYGEVLLKGNAKNVEPLFLEAADGDGGDDAGGTLDMNASTFVYESPLWRLLKRKRDLFITNRAIAQYIGFVIMQLKLLEKPSPKHRKLLYYCFHKIFEMRRLLRGETPHVRVRGDERDFILEIRSTDPSDGPMSTAELKRRAQRDLDEIVAEFEATRHRRPDEGDFGVALEWVALARVVYER